MRPKSPYSVPVRYLLSVDPSLTCSGWALFSVADGALCAVGKIRSLPPKAGLSNRYLDLQEKITSLFKTLKLGLKDVVVCEAETTMKDPRSAFRVERVRGIFETLARTYQCTVPGRINPRSVHNEIMGLKGKQVKREIVKETAVVVVRNLYGRELGSFGIAVDNAELKKHQDIVDAILVGHLGVVRVQSAGRAGISIDSLFS